MTLSRQRSFLAPEPGDDWDTIAQRCLPEDESGSAVAKLKSWNLHLFARNPPGSFTGSDVIFTEGPLEAEQSLLPLPADPQGG